ncbi:hypothetical protein ACHAXR_011143 [Thalassiosira sp. AJA248-18]
MRVAALKQELESYGISTKTFLEKGELVDALVQARKEGKTPIASSSSTSSSTSSSSSSTSSGSSTASTSSTTASTSSTSTASTSADRQERLQAELEKCKSLKVSDLKSELESYGVSTKSFFEKSEFVRAVAEARVDGVTKKSKKKKRRAVDDDEVEEVTAKVEVITSDNVGPKTKKTRDAADVSGGNAGAGGNPFGGAGGSPFGGAAGGANPFGGGGGMGGMDMGNIADMLKGMGGMGGAAGGANPFAGAAGGGGGGNPFAGAAGGGNPFGGGGAGMGDAMKAAQQAMSNPKVRAVIDKAQKNPKVMAAVQECMGNPMAMGKYMSDPEVGPILKELQEAMM